MRFCCMNVVHKLIIIPFQHSSNELSKDNYFLDNKFIHWLIGQQISVDFEFTFYDTLVREYKQYELIN